MAGGIEEKKMGCVYVGGEEPLPHKGGAPSLHIGKHLLYTPTMKVKGNKAIRPCFSLTPLDLAPKEVRRSEKGGRRKGEKSPFKDSHV